MQADSPATDGNDTRRDRQFELLALGRIVWGTAAYLAPVANARIAGLPGRPATLGGAPHPRDRDLRRDRHRRGDEESARAATLSVTCLRS